MPYCTNCGNEIGATDVFCGKCGTRQQPAGATPSPGGPPTNFLPGVSARTASILCYIPIIGWVAAVIVLASTRFRENRIVRFHAFQGLCLFVVWLIVHWVLSPEPIFHPHGFGPAQAFPGLLQLGVFAAWVWMIIKTSQDQVYRLPILGDLADRLVAEQR